MRNEQHRVSVKRSMTDLCIFTKNVNKGNMLITAILSSYATKASPLSCTGTEQTTLKFRILKAKSHAFFLVQSNHY